MRILITNDDGINAPGLAVMEEIAADLAGPGGEVWVVAPAFEQSGVGHALNHTRPTMIAKMAERRYAAEGSPADCVLAGIHWAMDARPDLLLSGVNRGNNAAENTVYSGTVGGAMEGALQGVTSVALSQFLGPRNWNEADPFESSRLRGAETIRRILAAAPAHEGGGYRTFYNVNFPPVPAAEVAGLRVVEQGYRGDGRFGMTAQESPTGRDYLWVTGGGQHDDPGPETDAGANLAGFVAVTPMRCDLTDRAALAAMREALA